MNINLPTPTEWFAPPPVRQGVVHEFYYTGNVSEPVWFAGRHLWKIRFRYGIVSTAKAETIRSEVSRLLERGSGNIVLPFAHDGTPFTHNNVAINVNHETRIITFPEPTRSAISRDVLQIDRYCLFPDPDGTPFKYVNVPPALVTGQYSISQGEGRFFIQATMTRAVPPEIAHISRKMARAGDLDFIEVP